MFLRDSFYEPGFGTCMKLYLRRTLRRSHYNVAKPVSRRASSGTEVAVCIQKYRLYCVPFISANLA